jgi:hypothetical protein
MAVTPEMIAVPLGVAAPEPDSLTWKQWALWISDAEMLIEARRMELDAPAIDEVKVDYVVRESVVAHVRKPDDATQVTVSVDDGSTSRSYSSGKGRVSVDDWWAFLGLVEPNTGAYAVNLIGAAPTHLWWCAVMLGANYCSCGVDIAGVPIFEGAGDDPGV